MLANMVICLCHVNILDANYPKIRNNHDKVLKQTPSIAANDELAY
jgi:hypothetical protein